MASRLSPSPSQRPRTHEPAVITLLHDIHPVPLQQLQLVGVLGSVLVERPVPARHSVARARHRSPVGTLCHGATPPALLTGSTGFRSRCRTGRARGGCWWVPPGLRAVGGRGWAQRYGAAHTSPAVPGMGAAVVVGVSHLLGGPGRAPGLLGVGSHRVRGAGGGRRGARGTGTGQIWGRGEGEAKVAGGGRAPTGLAGTPLHQPGGAGGKRGAPGTGRALRGRGAGGGPGAGGGGRGWEVLSGGFHPRLLQHLHVGGGEDALTAGAGDAPLVPVLIHPPHQADPLALPGGTRGWVSVT